MIGADVTGTDSVRSLLSSEHGGVVVMVAIALPVMILFVSFVVDIGNWFTHDRHLQTQADAAALAGAAEYRFPCDDATDEAVEAAARAYSGDEEGDGTYNHQIGTTPADEVHFVLNADNYFEDSGPVDTTVVEGSPCEAGMVDVKMTETDLPLFMQVLGLFSDVDYINTHARVEFFQREFFSGGLPVGVPDPNPRVGRVFFIDQTTGEELASAPLARNGIDDDLAVWDNSADPISLTVDRDNIGVRVAFGGAASTTCGDPLVECYDLEDDNTGILHVRGYSMAGSGAQPNVPLARNVWLTPGTCSDPYFVESETSCTIGVHAEVDFGTCRTGDALPDVGPSLTVTVDGTDYPLTAVDCPAGTTTSSWETDGAPIPIDPDAGPVPVELSWEETKGTVNGQRCRTTGGNKCKGDFGTVHRSYSAADSRSGFIRAAQIWEGSTAWANSFEQCSSVNTECTYDVVVKVGVDLNLSEACDDPTGASCDLVSLRFGAASGSQNQALDCDPNMSNLRDEIALGCEPEYARNEGTACPDSAGDLWQSEEPWTCVALQTGDATGQIWQGMNLRVHGEANPNDCASPNNWEDFPNLDPSDPRIVPVFITPFGSFDESGSGTVPVTDFAVFYASGWDDSQSTCADDDLAPDKSIVGHFIKYVQAFNDGSAGEEHCTVNELGSCVAVLTQ
jgi:Putative Flp pilus-assembly TadE/G-like